MENMQALMDSVNVLPFVIIGFTVFISIVVLVLTLPRFARLMGSERQNAQIRQHGLIAQARIMGFKETGFSVNDNPALDIHMEVMIPNQEPFRVTRRMVVSMLRIWEIQPGSLVPVKYNPANPNEVVIAL